MTQPLSLNNLPDVIKRSELAHLMRVSPLTLRRWEKKGILIPLKINERGERRYKRQDILDFLHMTEPFEVEAFKTDDAISY